MPDCRDCLKKCCQYKHNADLDKQGKMDNIYPNMER